jgi:hypothetical protein
LECGETTNTEEFFSGIVGAGVLGGRINIAAMVGIGDQTLMTETKINTGC